MSSARGFLLAGTQSGVGKTTISTGIMGALNKRDLVVKPFKVGPDYIDTQFHSYITGNPSKNLDAYLLEEKVIKNLFYKNLASGDIAVVEGVMGLYDGMGTKKDEGSSAHIGKILNLPVILIIDGRGMSSSAAAMVLGYKLYDPEVNIAGIIINNLSGEGHYKLLKEAIERDTGVSCVGYLNKNNDIQLESRHLGLVPCGEVPVLEEKIQDIVTMVEETIDIEKILSLSSTIEIKETPKTSKFLTEKRIKIAYAYDDAFNFYYQDNLELLKDLGCDLISFSPLKDKVLPKDIEGIYIGGGFPEVFGKELEKNQEMRAEILKKAKEGLPIYAECGGFMYLTKEIETLEGDIYQMVGIFNGRGKMTKRLQHFGYCEVETQENSNFFKETINVKAHEFHRSMVEVEDKDYIYHVKKRRNGEVVNDWYCGLEKYNCIGAFPHIHFYSNIKFAKAFIEKCRG